MISTVLFDPVSQSIETGASELIDSWKKSEDSILWLDMGVEDSGVERSLLSAMGIHPLAIDDALRERHPPKIEEFSDHVFMLFRGLDSATSGMESGTIQLAVFVGERFMISRHSKGSTSVVWLAEQVQANPKLMANGPGSIALMLGNYLVRRYVQILLDLEPRLDELEDEMREKPNDDLLAELTRYKSRLRRIARISNYHKEIANYLRLTPPAFVVGELEHEVTDLYEQVERTESLASLYKEVTSDLTDGYLALSSHRLNAIMQFLTIITVIFVPLSFIAGIYGMNFEGMPELDYRGGYFIVLSVMLTIVVSLLALFRKKGWF